MKKKIDKESYSYYKQLYKARKKRVEGSGKMMFDDTMLSQKEWVVAKTQYKSNKDIVDHQAYTYTKKQAKSIKDAYKRAGFKDKIKDTDIMYGVSDAGEVLDELITERYIQLLDEGMTPEEASQIIGSEFWGSE